MNFIRLFSSSNVQYSPNLLWRHFYFNVFCAIKQHVGSLGPFKSFLVVCFMDGIDKTMLMMPTVLLTNKTKRVWQTLYANAKIQDDLNYYCAVGQRPLSHSSLSRVFNGICVFYARERCRHEILHSMYRMKWFLTWFYL